MDSGGLSAISESFSESEKRLVASVEEVQGRWDDTVFQRLNRVVLQPLLDESRRFASALAQASDALNRALRQFDD